MAWTSLQVDGAGNLKRGLAEAEIRSALESREGLLWLDIEDISQEDADRLERIFGFHPLALATCVSSQVHTPTVQDFGEYLFLVLHGINYTSESVLVETTELDLFVGPNYVVSCHNLFLYSVSAVAQQAEEGGGRLMRRGADFLAYALIDGLVNNLQPAVERLVDRADDIEEVIFGKPHPTTLEAILGLKRSTLRLRRALVPQESVLAGLQHQQFDRITPESEVWYRNAHDHLVRTVGAVEGLRERTDTILATYLSALAHQQNETMKTLSVVAAIFLPLTLLAGIYGMNFENMPELRVRWAYYAVLGGMGTAATAIVWWFWARAWFTVGRRRLARFVPAAVDPERLLGHVGNLVRWHRL